MPRTLSPGDGLGLLQPLVAAETAAGREVRLWVEQNLVRGDPPQGSLAVGKGRGELEAQWDMGPLVAWFPVPGGWRLEDSTSLASLELGTAPEDDQRPASVAAGRPRLGHAADVSWLQDWGPYAVSGADELRRVQEPTWERESAASDWWRWHDQRRVVTREPADLVLARLQEVLLAVLPVLDRSSGDVDAGVAALPAWFRATCAPAWDSPAGQAERERIASLRGAEARRAGWAARWTPDEAVRHLLPDERVWRFHSATVVDEALHLCVQTPGFSTTLTSLKWLLSACGAEACAGSPAPR